MFKKFLITDIDYNSKTSIIFQTKQKSKMEFFREKYATTKGKSNSMYIYVLYKCPQEKLKDHITKQLEIIDRVNDSFKRKLFSSRYYSIKDMLEENPEDHIYNCVLFIDDELNQHKLTEYNMNLLERYNHQNITYVYDDHYKLDFVEDLLFNNDPYHVYRINNNKIDYIQMTKTKKNAVSSKEEKSLDIKSFVDSTLPPNKKYLLYGISSKLKNYSDERAYTIINKHIKDDELLEMVDKINQENILISFGNDMNMLNDPKQSHKIIFKKDLALKIKNSQLEKLYIETKMHDKFLENMKKNQLDITFKIIIIDSSLKSFEENKEKLIEQYGGVVGIAYY
jgi:hypothetical protein